MPNVPKITAQTEVIELEPWPPTLSCALSPALHCPCREPGPSRALCELGNGSNRMENLLLAPLVCPSPEPSRPPAKLGLA